MAIYSKSQTTVEGLDELIKECKKLGDDAVPFIKKVSDKIGNKILDRARQLVPVDTGKLKNSLYLKKPTNKKLNIYSLVGIGKEALYGIPLELGHKLVFFGKKTGLKVKERPFLRPAADENKEYAVQEIANAMNEALNTFGK